MSPNSELRAPGDRRAQLRGEVDGLLERIAVLVNVQAAVTARPAPRPHCGVRRSDSAGVAGRVRPLIMSAGR